MNFPNDYITTGAGAGGGGILGFILAFMGLKSRLSTVEMALTSLNKELRHVDTCTEITRGMFKRLDQIETNQAELLKDIKLILQSLS